MKLSVDVRGDGTGRGGNESMFRYNMSPSTVTIHRRESQDGSCTLVRLSL